MSEAAVSDELDAKLAQPYRVVVCLRFSDDPGFTRQFVAAVGRQVGDQLRGFFGTLAGVEVTIDSPLLKEREAAAAPAVPQRIRTAKLDELALSPAEIAEAKLPDKVFLADVDFDGGRYIVRWRQLDGEVQRLGPVRQRTTPDRRWLARAICLAVKDDFAPVAVFRPHPYEEGKVSLQLRGANVCPRPADGPSLLKRQWLADGSVLQPFWVLRQASGMAIRQPIPHTLLRIDESPTATRATVVSSLADPLRQTARVAGFQAVKLATRPGRLRLRLVDSETGAPVLAGTARVYVNDRGFEEIGDADLLANHDRHGYVTADRPLSHVAYVKIVTGAGGDIRLALPIDGEWCERECRIRVDRQAARKVDWQRRLSMVVQDLQVLQTMIDQYVREANNLNGRKQYEQALGTMRTALGSMQDVIRTARRDVDELLEGAAALDVSDNALLQWTGRQIESIERRYAELGELAAALEQTIEKVDAQQRARVLVNLASQAESTGNAEEAIAQYERALKQWPQMPKIRQHLDELQQTWQIKSPEHAAARRFVDETWTKADFKNLDSLLDEAATTLATLRQVDDHLTARKLLRITGNHLRELADIVDLLSARSDEEGRTQFQQYGELTERVARFQLEVGRYLAGGARHAGGAAEH